MTEMIEIDGSQGEGGGQIIRSSLALSAVTGRPIQLTNIRAGRKRSGLMRQHLTAVQAAAEVCHAKTEGADIGSRSVVFEPEKMSGGNFHFRVGTAGSASLVAQAVLPALMLADQPSTLILEGGTHNPWAPPFDFLQRSFLPQLGKMGPKVTATIDSHGFYPAGGGRFQLDITPCQALKGLSLLDHGGKVEPQVTAIVSGISKQVGERECDTIRRKSNWHPDCFQVHEVESPIGAGNAIMIELVSKHVTEIVTGFGKVGVKAEHIARRVLREARSYLASGVPVGDYLADQLMLPMGLAAHQGKTSEFCTGPLTMHSKTHLEILKIFLEIDVAVEEQDKRYIVRFSPA